ncbi:MAG: sugar porter family MFS transporter [Acidimicrobiales bacterium]|nr:sugar porter family MFS transporter [Acidimicrobiales bacterium]
MVATSGAGTPDGAPRPAARRIRPALIGVGVVIMLAGALFGYDQGVISGALTGIQKQFNVGTLLLEVITSWVTLGAMAGALVAGAAADRLGRRRTIVAAAALFVVGALCEATAPGTPVLVVGRLIVGFGVGVASVAAPLYAAELAPARVRGRMISLYQLAITIGIFVAYFADYLLTEGNQWRLMLGVSAIPAVLLFVAILPLPESARWFVKMHRHDEARAALRRVESERDVDGELAEMESLDRQEAQGGWRTVFAPAWRRPLVIGVALAALQQFTGINAIIYYADKIFAAAGFSSPTSQSLATLWAIGAVNVVSTFVAVAWVDRFGRKPLLVAGSIGMCASLVVVGAMFEELGSGHAGGTSAAGIVTMVGLVVFIASFAFSLGPVVWTIINEIFPSHIRGKAVAVATAANWFSAWLVAQFFLSLVDLITEAGTFWLFAGFCIVTLVFVQRVVPETKGRSLEELQRLWQPAGRATAASAASASSASSG